MLVADAANVWDLDQNMPIIFNLDGDDDCRFSTLCEPIHSEFGTAGVRTARGFAPVSHPSLTRPRMAQNEFGPQCLSFACDSKYPPLEVAR
jgi:hypothetical protein